MSVNFAPRGRSRRDFLARATAVALGAAFLPRPSLGAEEPAKESRAFEFIAVNDLHFTDPELCPPWFAKAFAAMKASAPRAGFVLMSGDLTMQAKEPEFKGIRAALERLELPVYVTPGNHDVTADGQHTLFEKYFPGRVNYAVEHRGWNLFCLNSVESRKPEGTRIPQDTLQWLDDNFCKFNPKRPTILSTHYPLGRGLVRRPRNADDLIGRFRHFNLKAVFNGHWHGFTETQLDQASVTTNRCCSRLRSNHDGSPLKGWFVCTARAESITREFVTVPPELMNA